MKSEEKKEREKHIKTRARTKKVWKEERMRGRKDREIYRERGRE